jgi:hypothetical protein
MKTLKNDSLEFRSAAVVADVVTICGAFGTIAPMTAAGRNWCAENLQVESWQWHGGAIVVERNYLPAIIDGMEDDGLIVSRD